MGDEKESNLPRSGKPSRRAAAGTMLRWRQAVQSVLYLWRAKDPVP